MTTTEIFEKLSALKAKIENDTEEPMLASNNSLLWDVAITLGLSDEQACKLAGTDITWYPKDEPETAPTEPESPHDFSGGFGIGGLGRYIEPPIIPSAAALEREERREARAIVCKRCGGSELTGAMFTTCAGGDVCDDCFG